MNNIFNHSSETSNHNQTEPDRNVVNLFELMLKSYFQRNHSISHKINEEINQNLAALKVQIDIAAQHPGNPQTCPSSSLLPEIITQLTGVMSQLRSISESIYTLQIDKSNFATSLKEIITSHQLHDDMIIHYKSSDFIEDKQPSNHLILCLIVDRFLDIMVKNS
ncbi:MAG: hypothetical protein LWX83_14830, partial [Anaerolineae bacterium]|nr:hypothetical protein [Anaerolineae bacterium]